MNKDLAAAGGKFAGRARGKRERAVPVSIIGGDGEAAQVFQALAREREQLFTGLSLGKAGRQRVVLRNGHVQQPFCVAHLHDHDVQHQLAHCLGSGDVARHIQGVRMRFEEVAPVIAFFRRVIQQLTKAQSSHGNTSRKTITNPFNHKGHAGTRRTICNTRTNQRHPCSSVVSFLSNLCVLCALCGKTILVFRFRQSQREISRARISSCPDRRLIYGASSRYPEMATLRSIGDPVIPNDRAVACTVVPASAYNFISSLTELMASVVPQLAQLKMNTCGTFRACSTVTPATVVEIEKKTNGVWAPKGNKARADTCSMTSLLPAGTAIDEEIGLLSTKGGVGKPGAAWKGVRFGVLTSCTTTGVVLSFCTCTLVVPLTWTVEVPAS